MSSGGKVSSSGKVSSNPPIDMGWRLQSGLG